MASAQNSQLKDEVRHFWNAEPCGSRYLEGADDLEAFEAHARSRYALEPQHTSKAIQLINPDPASARTDLRPTNCASRARGVY